MGTSHRREFRRMAAGASTASPELSSRVRNSAGSIVGREGSTGSSWPSSKYTHSEQTSISRCWNGPPAVDDDCVMGDASGVLTWAGCIQSESIATCEKRARTPK